VDTTGGADVPDGVTVTLVVVTVPSGFTTPVEFVSPPVPLLVVADSVGVDAVVDRLPRVAPDAPGVVTTAPTVGAAVPAGAFGSTLLTVSTPVLDPVAPAPPDGADVVTAPLPSRPPDAVIVVPSLVGTLTGVPVIVTGPLAVGIVTVGAVPAPLAEVPLVPDEPDFTGMLTGMPKIVAEPLEVGIVAVPLVPTDPALGDAGPVNVPIIPDELTGTLTGVPISVAEPLLVGIVAVPAPPVFDVVTGAPPPLPVVCVPVAPAPEVALPPWPQFCCNSYVPTSCVPEFAAASCALQEIYSVGHVDFMFDVKYPVFRHFVA
jgi:hypothetical protein